MEDEGPEEAIDEPMQAADEAARSGETDLAPGARLGRYEVISPLGEGGMGHVHRARDTALGRDVAIKLLNPTVLASDSGRSRFEREARAAAALKHRNIVTVHDIGEDRGRPFIVMELVDGETLRAKMAAGCGLDECLPWAAQIAAALTAAHEAGIAHRDLKPENVIIDAQGEAQIVDFGLAGLEGAGAKQDSDEPTLTRLTGAGFLMGTLGYMSPEAASGESTDYRSDQFALGAILFEMVTGRRFFEGKTPQEVLIATLQTGAPDPSELRKAPAGLQVFLERCLARTPEGRWEKTADLLAALERLLEEPEPDIASAPALPKPLTELVGRGAEREAIRGLLIDQGVRLVTLTGPGGGGKTRLALQVAEDLFGPFDGRVYFVELGAIRDAALVLPALGRELGAAGDRAPIDAIRAELSSAKAPSLVVLDNFEQVVSAARDLGELLAKVEGLSLLVTSREVLRIYGEYDFPVEPLAYPRGSSLPPLEELERYPAVALFAARARAAKPSFALSAANAPAVIELCARLDGLPLALELAAARVRTLTPQAMLARLEARKSLLTSGARDLPARQQTLRATIDWSHELIGEGERTLLRRLGVFVGGFTLEAAEAVANGYGDLDIDVVDGVTSLVDKSLVQAVESPDEDSRFILLETIREFCQEKLGENDEQDQMGKAHAAYYLLIAEEGGAELARGGGAQWLETFQIELDNCRSALDWLTANGEAEWGLRLALGLFDYWDRTGQLIEGQHRYNKLLALPASHEHKRLRARGLFSASTFAATRSLLDEALGLQEESLELYREIGDLRGQAVALNGIGINCSTNSFDHERARKTFAEAIDLWKELDEEVGYARSLSNLAWVCKTEGELTEARRMYREAGEIFGAVGNPTEAAWAVDHEADVVVESGDLEKATALYRDALEQFEQLGYRWGVATTLADLAAVAASQSDWSESTRLARGALEIFAKLDHKRGVARLFESLAVAALDRGAPEIGLTLIASAGTLRQRLGVPLSGDERTVLDDAVERLTAAAGGKAAKAAWTAGESRPVAEVVRLALDF
ncbi:MAG: protein kinase [Acidobacteriota bacterium]|nr:protein kinase [Acidobacteriota bacterium]